jgi:hypothetical protein
MTIRVEDSGTWSLPESWRRAATTVPPPLAKRGDVRARSPLRSVGRWVPGSNVGWSATRRSYALRISSEPVAICLSGSANTGRARGARLGRRRHQREPLDDETAQLLRVNCAF